MPADWETRPIRDEERPDLERLGFLLRALRRAAALTQEGLATRAGITGDTVSRLELGQRRTRASTLRRLGRIIAAEAPGLGTAEKLGDQLIAAAGDSLSPESPRMRSIERRRDRIPRAMRRRKMDEAALERHIEWVVAERLAEELAHRKKAKDRDRVRARRRRFRLADRGHR